MFLEELTDSVISNPKHHQPISMRSSFLGSESINYYTSNVFQEIVQLWEHVVRTDYVVLGANTMTRALKPVFVYSPVLHEAGSVFYVNFLFRLGVSCCSSYKETEKNTCKHKRVNAHS